MVSICGMGVRVPFGAVGCDEVDADSEDAGGSGEGSGEDLPVDGGDAGALPSINGVRRFTLTIFLRGKCMSREILIRAAR
jgi:hypothetical protein